MQGKPDGSPSFSIVMATYNRAKLLPRSINSVLNQTYRNFELIIVDDGSTDNTEDVVRYYEDPRIVFRKQANHGVLDARNSGLDLARGDYITLLDDDDELLPEALERAKVEIGRFPSAGLLWFDGLDSETRTLSGWGLAKEEPILYEDLLCGRVGGNHWQIIRRSALKGNRFDKRLYCGELLLWVRILRESGGYYIPRVLRINHQDGSSHLSEGRAMLNHLPLLILTNKAILSEFGKTLKSNCPKAYYRRMAILRLYQIIDRSGLVKLIVRIKR